MKKETPFLLLFRILFGCIGAAIVLFCAWRYVAVGGTVTVVQDFRSSEDSLISLFIPVNQVTDIMQNLRTGETTQSIKEGPVYFTARLPRAFDSVTATIQYATEYHGPATFGVVELLSPLAVKEKIFAAPIVNDAIREHWKITTDELTGNTVYSKDGLSFGQVQERVAKGDAVAVVNADMQVPYRDATYQADTAEYRVPYTLRGSHVFYTYVKDESLEVRADLIDGNLSIGSDPVTVTVLNEQNEAIQTQRFVDDGNKTENRTAGTTQQLRIDLPNVPEGVYRIRVETSGDVRIENLVTAQRKFVIQDHLILDNLSRPFTLQVGSRFVTAVTGNAEALGDVRVDNADLSLTALGEVETIRDLKNNPTVVTGNHADIEMTYAGYAAFDPAAYFDPDYAVQPVGPDMQLSDVTAIVTHDFTPPTENYRGFESTVELPLTGVLGDRKKLQFSINAPELLSHKDSITVDSITLTFHGPSLWERLTNRFTQ